MNIPGFLIPIVALEVVAVLAVICGLWLLFTNKLEADELDRPPRRRGHTTATDKTPEPAAVSSSANRAPKTTEVEEEADAEEKGPDVEHPPSPVSGAVKGDSPERTGSAPRKNVLEETNPS